MDNTHVIGSKSAKDSLVFITVFMLLFTLASAASAHSLYIQSGCYKVRVNKDTPLFFCCGHHLPVDEPVRAKKLSTLK